MQQAAQGPKVQHYQARERGPDGELLPFVANVAWRRSGHALLRTLLRRTLGQRFGYCEFPAFPQSDTEGRCCKAFPCRKAGRINMSRQHDPNLSETLPDGHPLVVLIRPFGDATVSHYEIVARRGKADDSPEGFRQFAEQRLPQYNGFKAKWIDAPRSNRVVLTFDELVDDRAGAVGRVLPLFGVERTAGEILEATSDVPHKPKRDVTGFRFYDPDLFDDLNARANDTAERV